MAKVVPVTYEPTEPPTKFLDWHWWITDELHRIKQAMAANPVVQSVSGTGTIGIDDVPTTVRLGIGDVPLIDVPDGSWNSTLGEYTAPLGGLYSITAQAFLAAFGAGNKNYFGKLELFINDQSRAVAFQGGGDDVPLTVSLIETFLILAADVIHLELTTEHEQFTGSTDYNFGLSIIRLASA